MKVEIEHVATCVRRLTIEVPADKVNHEFSAIYNDLQQRVRMPGFRQGKVPRRLLESYYHQSVEQEVLRKLVQNAKMKVVVADHSKLGSVSKYLLCPAKGIDKLITDIGASASAVAPFEKLGIDVTVV